VTKPGAENRRNNHRREQGIEDLEVYAFFDEDLFHPLVAQKEAQKEKDLVVANEKWAEFDSAVGNPGDSS
jgi:poly-gamma-glutamate capsule biosynthesis protein CapA/YwtB (metallophosphatase superfamily)